MGDGFARRTREDGAFRVRGARIERIAAQTNFDVEESAERFQRDLARLGIDAELRRDRRSSRATSSGSGRPSWSGSAQPWESRDERSGARLVVRPVSASSEARSTPSTSRIWRSPSPRAMPWVSSACCSSRPANRRTSRSAPSPPAADRLAMVELAIEGNAAFEASRLELDRSGPSYTVDTLAGLADGTADLG